MPLEERWAEAPADHDYPAAVDYLSLLMPATTAEAAAAALRQAPTESRKAKDLLRAGGLHLLPADDEEVAADLRKVKKGQRLSPVLLVRGDARVARPLLVADGYHRICASYHLGDDTPVRCRIVDLPSP